MKPAPLQNNISLILYFKFSPNPVDWFNDFKCLNMFYSKYIYGDCI